jgi:OmpA-OmpF porin, OOP family
MYKFSSRPALAVWGQLAIATALGFATQGALAQSASSTNNTTMGPSATYIGLSVGSSDFSKPSNGFGIFSNDQRATAYSLNMGNYFINPNLGMEVGYTDFGSVNRAGGTTKIDGINISLIGRAPLSSSFNLLGKIGTTYGRADVSSAPTSGVTAGSERGFDWSYGIGAELIMSPRWSGVLQYDEHYVKFPGGSSDRVSATSLGVRYRY